MIEKKNIVIDRRCILNEFMITMERSKRERVEGKIKMCFYDGRDCLRYATYKIYCILHKIFSLFLSIALSLLLTLTLLWSGSFDSLPVYIIWCLTINKFFSLCMRGRLLSERYDSKGKKKSSNIQFARKWASTMAIDYILYFVVNKFMQTLKKLIIIFICFVLHVMGDLFVEHCVSNMWNLWFQLNLICSLHSTRLYAPFDVIVKYFSNRKNIVRRLEF